MSLKTRILFDGNDRVTVLTTFLAEIIAAGSPTTLIDAGGLLNAKTTGTDFRISFESASWSVSGSELTLVFLDSTPSSSSEIISFGNQTNGSINCLIANDTGSPDGGDIACHTSGVAITGHVIMTFRKVNNYDFTGNRYSKVGQANPYIS